MDINQANTIHEYILEHDLLIEVEARTKSKWKGNGSRASYYNGLAKIRKGEETGLVESLILLEAESVMLEHRKWIELANGQLVES